MAAKIYCLKRYYKEKLPDALKNAFPETDSRCNRAGEQFVSGNEFIYKGYIFTYLLEKHGDGQRGGFTLMARPKEYGVDGVRSYFATDSSPIHATAEDRPATSNDANAVPDWPEW